MITKYEIYEVIPRHELIKAMNEFKFDHFRSVHGIPHWMRVLHNGLLLSEQNGANKKIIIAFAFFHDIKREHECDDPEHGSRGGRRLLSLKYKINLSKDELNKVIEACENHTSGLHHDDLDISTCWDSDRLDLYRVGIEPEPDYLNHDWSKDENNISDAMDRSMAPAESWMLEIVNDLKPELNLTRMVG